jgi:hypothetical protein
MGVNAGGFTKVCLLKGTSTLKIHEEETRLDKNGTEFNSIFSFRHKKFAMKIFL